MNSICCVHVVHPGIRSVKSGLLGPPHKGVDSNRFLCLWPLDPGFISGYHQWYQHGAQCSSINFTFHSIAWPLNLLEKHCKLWKGQPVNSSDFSSQWTCLPRSWWASSGLCSCCFLCRGGWADLPTFLRSSDRSSGSVALCAHWETRGNRREEEEYRFLACLLLLSIFTCLPETRSDHLSSSVQFADPSRLLHTNVCLLLGNPHYASNAHSSLFRGSHIFFCLIR